MNVAHSQDVIEWQAKADESPENQKIWEEEVRHGIKKVKKGKSDQISEEILKHMGESALKFVTKLYNQCWNGGSILKEWKNGYYYYSYFQKGR